jgi:hypothetical protein
LAPPRGPLLRGKPPTGAESYQAATGGRVLRPPPGESGEDTSVPTNGAARMAKAMLDKVEGLRALALARRHPGTAER